MQGGIYQIILRMYELVRTQDLVPKRETLTAAEIKPAARLQEEKQMCAFCSCLLLDCLKQDKFAMNSE